MKRVDHRIPSNSSLASSVLMFRSHCTGPDADVFAGAGTADKATEIKPIKEEPKNPFARKQRRRYRPG